MKPIPPTSWLPEVRVRTFADAVAELIAASSRPLAWDETQEAARAVCSHLPSVARTAIDDALARLRAPIAAACIPSAGLLALCCGAMVEAGGDAQLTVGAIADRLPETMTRAQQFVAACSDEADAQIRADGDDDAAGYGGDPVADFGDVVREHYPDDADAFQALDPMGLGAIAMMSSSAAIRTQVRQRHPGLVEQALALQPVHPRAGFLATMLRVLDREPLLAIHPALGRGYLLEMGGIATNFELFILIADALIGDPAAGWLPGERPDPRVAAACRNAPVVPGAEHALGAFNLWQWTALGRDGTLPSGEQLAGAEHWVWLEGVPADIGSFDGLRVVLLGPPPYARILQAGRCFRDMPADLRVTRVLSSTEVSDWLGRFANAPRPRSV